MLKLTLPADRANTDMTAVAAAFGISVPKLEAYIKIGKISDWLEVGSEDQDNKPHKIFASRTLGVRVDTDEHGNVVATSAYDVEHKDCGDMTRPTAKLIPADDSTISNAKRLDQLLDEALDESFPASDPIAVSVDYHSA
jgi:hypothetical protein